MKLLLVVAMASGGTLLFGQDSMKARELFYSPSKMVVKPAGAAAAATPAPAATATSASAASSPKKPAMPSTPTPASNASSASGPFQNASMGSAPVPNPLGLRYSIVQRMRNGQEREVDPETVFRTGEQIRLRVEANDIGYLYVAQKGSKGNWTLLMPSPEVNGGKNKVTPYKRYEIPSEDVFEFSGPAGEFKIFIALTRQPEPDFEKLIAVMQQGGSKPNEGPKKNEVLAMNFDDRLIGDVKGKLVARDLVVSKVKRTDDTAGYAVNASGKSDSRVVAELTLRQQE